MPALALVVVLLGGWEAVVRAGLVDPLILPAPTSVGRSLVEDRSILVPDLWTTATEAVLGLLAAVLIGVVLGVAMHLWPPVRRALQPLVVASQALPIPVVAALLLVLLGFGVWPKVVVVALVSFFPVAINVLDGLGAVPAEQRKLLRSLGAGRRRTLVLLEAPAALPQAFTGLRLAAAVAVIGAVFGEWNGSESGLGHLVLTSTAQLETARGYAATVLLFLLALALYGACSLLERRTIDWKP